MVGTSSPGWTPPASSSLSPALPPALSPAAPHCIPWKDPGPGLSPCLGLPTDPVTSTGRWTMFRPRGTVPHQWGHCGRWGHPQLPAYVHSWDNPAPAPGEMLARYTSHKRLVLYSLCISIFTYWGGIKSLSSYHSLSKPIAQNSFFLTLQKHYLFWESYKGEPLLLTKGKNTEFEFMWKTLSLHTFITNMSPDITWG